MLSLPFSSRRFVEKHGPNFEQKRFEYIAEMGLDSVTGKEADEELLNYATNYTKYAPSIKAGYDFLMVGVAAWSTRAYNKDIQTQRADAQINEYYQIKDAVRTQIVGSQPVVPNAEMNIGIPKLNYSSLPDNAQNSYSIQRWVGKVILKVRQKELQQGKNSEMLIMFCRLLISTTLQSLIKNLMSIINSHPKEEMAVSTTQKTIKKHLKNKIED